MTTEKLERRLAAILSADERSAKELEDLPRMRRTMAFSLSVPEEQENILDIFARYPEHARLLDPLVGDVMRTGECAFTSAERELIGGFVSAVNSCVFCSGVHKATAEAFGVDEGLIEALVDDIETAAIDDRLKPVLRYVRKLTLTPAKMTQSDADAVFAAGWDERDFHYAVTICALFNFYNRWLDGHGIKGTPDVHALNGRVLYEHGYALPPEIAQEA